MAKAANTTNRLGHLFRPLILVGCVIATGPTDAQTSKMYSAGQLWTCTKAPGAADQSPGIRILVTGTAKSRDVSRRLNFQTDDIIVSVALLNDDPKACAAARQFQHLAFSETALNACAPRLMNGQEDPDSLGWKAARDARGKWLIGMQRNKGVVIGLDPLSFISMVQRRRCN